MRNDSVLVSLKDVNKTLSYVNLQIDRFDAKELRVYHEGTKTIAYMPDQGQKLYRVFYNVNNKSDVQAIEYDYNNKEHKLRLAQGLFDTVEAAQAYIAMFLSTEEK